MRFEVPQFIEREAKVVGSLTLRQAGTLLAPLSVALLVYFWLPLPLFLLLMVILETIAIAMAFVKVNGRHLPKVVLDIILFSANPKRFIWRRGNMDIQIQEVTYGNPNKKQEDKQIPLSRESKIQNLATQVQTKN
ncbi:MAG: hypothetical protein A3E07_02300 [Candidatus Wildermuthbacteria bacterium RIFCSPHIGHO2_12_FULL_45_9]|uniref:PrgI family protein n=1 Tax=Candidatus Wildermuthbacteria bacterium RIFCSPHIGHO2_02_FULL_45_25 TaxID=1802450 RepID=A0A1G2QZK1_9BACT|nr:MAG: hypothetical protein A3C04_00105 [Candidatus Wildermuthbacteria bacterium RIFCSPHIGHO2_02_FULL_45_25]OHA70856.1 MAG: hypothetical protein A3E07_02300 [Candidatus Wildermuthbacteria bacterium RIFCSPHIGHO2_12_FULL_45_9]